MQFANKLMWAAAVGCGYGVYACYAQGPSQQNVLIVGGSLAIILLANMVASRS